MSAENWDEIRTAYQVARLGTVSAAAEALGVHHATVIRHVDALEQRLGVKLFQRHARGYRPTEAGEDLLKVAAATEDQFNQLVGRLQGAEQEISGELNVTTVAELSPLIMPSLAAFQRDYPDIQVNYISDHRLFRLEYGEAHVAVRAGAKPQEPDNIVQEFCKLPTRLCASKTYVEAHGLPSGPEEFAGHRFVTSQKGARPPSAVWMEQHLGAGTVVLRATEYRACQEAVRQGIGIGFMNGNVDLAAEGLVEVMPPLTEWYAPLWLVTHVDLHRTPKVQAALHYLKKTRIPQ